jgi:hypothetical protein
VNGVPSPSSRHRTGIGGSRHGTQVPTAQAQTGAPTGREHSSNKRSVPGIAEVEHSSAQQKPAEVLVRLKLLMGKT